MRMRTERVRLSLEEVKYHRQIKRSLRGVKHRNPHQTHPEKKPGTAPYSVMPGFKLCTYFAVIPKCRRPL